MSDVPEDEQRTPESHAQFIEERKMLIDAARESARTFDQAILAFGSAVFGFSIGFVKDVAPHPELYTLKWLAIAWFLFSTGLLSVLLSFLFSHQACMFEIQIGVESLSTPEIPRKSNRWSTATTACNYSCVGLLFFGILCWSVFAFENLIEDEVHMSNQSTPPPKVERGYTPPPPPPRVPPPQPPSPPAAPLKK